MADTESTHRFRFSDDTMFRRVMRNEDICKGVIERIIGRPIGRVEYLNTQQEASAGPLEKSICMDGYLVESGGRRFDVEMQVNRNQLLPLRYRGYQSVLDVSALKRGGDYDSLPEIYIIFICMKDPFDAGEPIYTIEPTCHENPQVNIQSRAHWIALNASAYAALDEDGELRSLLEYVYTEKIPEGDGLVNRIDAEVSRENGKEWSMLFSSMETAKMEARVQGRYEGRQEGRQEGLEEGREEGRQEGRSEGVAEERERLSRLAVALAAAGRAGDLQRAAANPGELERLYGEFGI